MRVCKVCGSTRFQASGKCSPCAAAWKLRADRADPRRYLLSNARQRAKAQGVACDIGLDDIVIPETCPVLGIPIVVGRGRGGFRAGSPSLDKLRPELGYTKNNVVVISHRANMIKGDATCAELEAVLQYIRTNTQPWTVDAFTDTYFRRITP